MKKILLAVFCVACVLFPFTGKSQNFSVPQDTLYVTVGGLSSPADPITNNTSSTIKLNWQVINCNFIHSWLADSVFGICDNITCYNNGGDGSGHSMQLWNDTTRSGDIFTTSSYSPGPGGEFNLSLNFTNVPTGTGFVTIKITQPLGTIDTVTFIINKVPTGVPSVNGNSNVLLYPNPADGEINVVYDASADVKSLAVYNIIGKMMTVYKVNGPSANLNIENMPSGVYFMRLYNSQGNVVSTKKFSKQ